MISSWRQTLHVKFLDNYIVDRIKKMQAEFGDNLLIVRQSMLKTTPLKMLQAIEQHLDVPSYFTEDNFNKDKINASGRSNAVWLSWLLSRESVIDLINKLFPRSLVLKARDFFDSFASGTEKTIKDPRSEEDIALAKQLIAKEQAWVNELFKDSNLLSGSGKAFNLKQ